MRNLGVIIASAMFLGGCGATRRSDVCRGVTFGSVTAPTVRIAGTLDKLAGSFRALAKRDICALYGAPKSVRSAGSEQTWFYVQGIGIANFPGAGGRIRFRHSSGTIVFHGTTFARSTVKTQGSRAAIGG